MLHVHPQTRLRQPASRPKCALCTHGAPKCASQSRHAVAQRPPRVLPEPGRCGRLWRTQKRADAQHRPVCGRRLCSLALKRSRVLVRGLACKWRSPRQLLPGPTRPRTASPPRFRPLRHLVWQAVRKGGPTSASAAGRARAPMRRRGRSWPLARRWVAVPSGRAGWLAQRVDGWAPAPPRAPWADGRHKVR